MKENQNPLRLTETLRTLAESSVSQLFSDYGVQLAPGRSESMRDHRLFFGIVGFCGPQMRGSAVLACAEPVILASDPVQSGPRSWTGELTNQFIGRFKNQLLSFGVEIYITTPVVFRGDQLNLEARPRSSESAFHTAEGHHVAVWVDTDPVPGFVLEEPKEGRTVILEGEAMMF
jgi:hypothetical protein